MVNSFCVKKIGDYRKKSFETTRKRLLFCPLRFFNRNYNPSKTQIRHTLFPLSGGTDGRFHRHIRIFLPRHRLLHLLFACHRRARFALVVYTCNFSPSTPGSSRYQPSQRISPPRCNHLSWPAGYRFRSACCSFHDYFHL